MLAMIGAEVARLIGTGGAKAIATGFVQLLKDAIALHADIRQQTGLILKDGTSAYQDPWRITMEEVLRDNAEDYNYLELL
jgi:hypothetical protein